MKAKKSCTACYRAKRKCDMLTPICSLCSRLGRRCQYGLGTNIPFPAVRQLSQRHGPQLRSSTASVVFDDKVGRFSTLDNTITERLARLVGGVLSLSTITSKYFNSIHIWFPIISESSFVDMLPHTFENQCPEQSLLLLSMALITTLPPEEDSARELYIQVKGSIAMVEAANVNTLAVIQSRLLVTLFEFGHGLPAAFISIAATVRAAVAIGLNNVVQKSCGDGWPVNGDQEERHRVWWGIVMLDRIYALERGDALCATQSLEPPRHLPRDMGSLDQKILSATTPLPLSTPSNVCIGPFARQAQVSHVVGIFLTHLSNGKLAPSPERKDVNQLARTLTAFSLLLPEGASSPWPRYCGAIGMCYAALITLHSNDQDQNCPINIGIIDCAESLASVLDCFQRIAGQFNKDIDGVGVDAISPFPPYGLAKAASLQLRLWKETGDPTYGTAVKQLTVMLTHFSKRWGNAKKLLDSLLEEQKLYEVNEDVRR